MPQSVTAVPHQDRRLIALGLRFMSATAFSMMSVMIKLASDHHISLPEILFWRQAGAAPLILGWVLIGPGLASLKTGRLRMHVTRSLIGLTSMTFMFTGLSLLPLAEAIVLGFTMPIFATIFAAVMLHEATGWHRWGAVICGFIGVLIMVAPGGSHFPLLGASVALIAAVLSALVTVLLRDMSKTEPPATTAFWFSALSLIPLGPLLIHFGQAHNPTDWLLLFSIGAFGAVGQIGMTSSLKWAPVSTVVAVDYVSLIWSTLCGWLIWQALPTASAVIGAQIIIACGLYIAWREHRLQRDRVKEMIA